MIITVGICLIATLTVLANYKALRIPWILAIAFIISAGLLAAGIYLALQSKEETSLYAAFLCPFTALSFLVLSRIIYKRQTGTEIILYLHGIYPIRHEERFVTRLEKAVTFLVTSLSVAIPVMVIYLIS